MAKKIEQDAADLWASKLEGMAPVAPELFAHRPEHEGKPNPIAGILMERRTVRYKDGREGVQYVLATTLPTYLVGDDGEAELQPEGSFALVSERADLRSLARYLPQVGPNGFEAVCEVVIRPLKKVPLKGGKTMWKFDVRGRQLRAADSPVTLLAAPTHASAQLESAEHGDDVIPF
jgi:hypothetical protein